MSTQRRWFYVGGVKVPLPPANEPKIEGWQSYTVPLTKDGVASSVKAAEEIIDSLKAGE